MALCQIDQCLQDTPKFGGNLIEPLTWIADPAPDGFIQHLLKSVQYRYSWGWGAIQSRGPVLCVSKEALT